jgi:hypothetical protein
MKRGLVERREREVRRVNHARALPVREPHEPVIQLAGVVMLAVHVEQHANADLSLGELLEERLDPLRLGEKEIESVSGAFLLHAVNEKIIRVQPVGHHEVVAPRHGQRLSARARGGASPPWRNARDSAGRRA